MSVLTLGQSGSLTFRAPKPLDGGNNKTYSGSYSVTNGEFQEYILGYDGSLIQGGLVGWNLAQGGSIVCAADNGTDAYTKYEQYVESQVFTSTTPNGYIWTVANTQSVIDRYFGGTAPTVYQVWDKINQKYGEHVGYTLVYTAGNYPGIPDPIKPGEDPNGIKGCITSFPYISNNLYARPTWLSSETTITAPAFCTSYEMLVAWILFGDPVPPNHLHFDVYIDGQDEPNIAVRWSCLSKEDTFSLQTVNVEVAAYMVPYIEETAGQHPTYLDPDRDIYRISDVMGYVGDEHYTWGAAYKYNTNYITQNDTLLADFSSIQKLMIYGGDIADNLRLYLQFKQQVGADMTFGQIYTVNVPQKNITTVYDMTVGTVDPSEYHNTFSTTVTVHLGSPPDKDKDDDDEYPDPDPVDPDFTPGEVVGFPGKAVLTKTYSMTDTKLENIGTKLWSQSYLDVMKIQSNPIENIVGCKWYPFSLSGTEKDVVIGDVNFGIRADEISTKYVATIGSYTYNGPFNGEKVWMAMSPYATVKLHLPYVGIVQLDATEIFGRALTVKYTVDLITGDCLVLLYLDGTMPYMSIPGSLGVDIPLTSTNRVQSEIRAASGALSAGISAATQLATENYAGAAAAAAGGFLNFAGSDYTSQRTANHNSACSTWENHSVYIEIWYHPNAEANSSGFKKLHGLPCHKYTSILDGSLNGFVQADQRTKIDFAMTAEENRMLESLIKNGVYVN